MSRHSRSDLDQQFDRLGRKLPDTMARVVRRLRRLSSRWVRIPAAVLLSAAGVVGFLPILGF